MSSFPGSVTPNPIGSPLVIPQIDGSAALSAFEKKVATLRAQVGDLAQWGPEHIKVLLETETVANDEHQFVETLREYNNQLVSNALNNEQRGWYGLPLLPKPLPNAFLYQFIGNIKTKVDAIPVSPDSTKKNLQIAYFNGIKEGLRRQGAGSTIIDAVDNEQKLALGV